MNQFKRIINTLQGLQDTCIDGGNEIRLDFFKRALKRYDSANWEDGLNASEDITINIDDEFEVVFSAVIPQGNLEGVYNETGILETEPCYIIEILEVTMDGEIIHLDDKTEQLILNKFND